MKYVSLFAGIGGFDLALNRLGHECVYANEWDRYAADTYEKNFKHRPDTRDIKAVDASEIPDHDLLVGGFPCQSFSVAGQRKGFADTRGTLFFDIARILNAKKPSYILLENVKGLLSHDNNKTFQTIMRTLDELGYDLQWQICNSRYFVPQNRERIFIVGHLRGTSRPKVFPITESNEIHNEQGNIQTANTISSNYWKGVGGSRPFVQRIPLKFLQRNQKNIKGDYAYTIDGANAGGVMISKTVRAGGRKSPHGSKQNWDSYKVQGQIRRLTPLECERLQGFPDNWTEGVSDTQRYKQLGNAVTVNVVSQILELLEEGKVR